VEVVSGAPPFPREEKGELEGVLVHLYLFPFQQEGDKGDGIPIKETPPQQIDTLGVKKCRP
jgi:hypothetical protein